MRRTRGASWARSAWHVSHAPVGGGGRLAQLTVARGSPSVDTRTNNHDIVNDGKTALATDPLRLSVLYPTVCEDSRLVQGDTLLLELAGEGQVFGGEEVPRRAVDDFIGSVAEDVDDGVGRIEDARLVREVCRRWSVAAQEAGG